MKKKYGKNLIFEDFIHDREVKMYHCEKLSNLLCK